MSVGPDMWSRRRAAVQAEAEADEKQRHAVIADAERAELAKKEDAEILAELKLTDPDDLGLGDDFSGFMKSAVPERLRRRALRKLWLSNPVLANVDNLVDYGEDFTDAGSIVGKIKTAYQVGRGMLKHVEEIEHQTAEGDGVDDLPGDPGVEAEPEPQELAPADVAPEEPVVTAEAEVEHTQTPVPQRRMRFEFAGHGLEDQ